MLISVSRCPAHSAWGDDLYRAFAVSKVVGEGEDLAKRAFDSLQALVSLWSADRPSDCQNWILQGKVPRGTSELP
jgi:hypothetical protein